ncbi:MAG: LLM class flavin-dependent oxidoreductase [Actinomycetota bacterium]|nr:LLM class flavin-dependent oxidoreductase [Actinomycetota bacterium]
MAGWDTVFLADPVWGVSPWIALAACASVTERIRLGTMLTPPSVGGVSHSATREGTTGCRRSASPLRPHPVQQPRVPIWCVGAPGPPQVDRPAPLTS